MGERGTEGQADGGGQTDGRTEEADEGEKKTAGAGRGAKMGAVGAGRAGAAGGRGVDGGYGKRGVTGLGHEPRRSQGITCRGRRATHARMPAEEHGSGASSRGNCDWQTTTTGHETETNIQRNMMPTDTVERDGRDQRSPATGAVDPTDGVMLGNIISLDRPRRQRPRQTRHVAQQGGEARTTL